MHMNRTFVFAAVAAIETASACGGSGPKTPANAKFEDGTRLKAVYQRIDGAPPVFLNWYDTKLKVDCSFADVGLPDRLVCFPTDPIGADVRTLFASGTDVFADSACTERLVDAVFAPCETRLFATGPALGDACGSPVHLFALGETVPLDPAGVYNRGPSGTGPCQPATPSALETYSELHRVGSEIAIDSLVSGTYEHDGGAGRIVPVRIVGSDGSIQGHATTDPTWWAASGVLAWDNERAELVTTPLRPGSRWIPAVDVVTGLFANAACSVPAVVGPACGTPAKDAYEWATDACGYPAPESFFEVGPRLADQASVFFQNVDACEPYPGGAAANPKLATFAIGAPIPPTAFADAEEIRTGTGQIQIVQATTAGGAAAFDVGFFDSVHGQPCTFQRNLQAADGVVRCLPPTTPFESYYADADCTLPLFSRTSPTMDDCSPLFAFGSIVESVPLTSACYMPKYRAHIFPLVDTPYDGEVFDHFAGGDGPDLCLDVGSNSVLNFPLSLAGSEIPAGEFAALDEVRPN